MKKRVHLFIYILLLCNTINLFAQTEPEDVALDKDEFTDAYYESLIQKGIENYDKAIESLEKCLKIQPENPVIYHELGKNYFFRKDYANAETVYTKASQLDPKNKWYLIDLFDVYYETKNYNQALLIAEKIVPLDKNYREDMVSLYMYTQQYDKALVLINDLNESVGKSEIRDRYKQEIQLQTKSNSSSKNELENAIEKSPLNEENYLSLIYKYSDNNQEEKARQIAEKLQKNIPNSEWAPVFLFKYYINDNKGDEASKALETVLKSSKIDKKIKFKMFNEFLIFTTKNPAYETQLNNSIKYFENDAEFNVYKETGKFYYKKKNWSLAINSFEKAGDNDLECNLLYLSALEETNDLNKLEEKAKGLVDLYPNQPEYYFFVGKALNKLAKYKNANIFLESGIDYVVDNKALEVDFLMLLAEASKGLNNTKKAEEYLAKANNLKNVKK